MTYSITYLQDLLDRVEAADIPDQARDLIAGRLRSEITSAKRRSDRLAPSET